ncbi:hypothetical protein [Microbacterium sp.]|uniref:hypothetical protein n=1 Tax=Microbacterium sp. TaxID=51671 RepID=UPI003A94A523
MRRTNMYVAYWAPDEDGAPGVLKVGVEKSDQRHREWIRRGAVLLAQFYGVPASWEKAAHAALGERFIRAFDSEGDAKWLLGTGYGFSECFLVAPNQQTEALRIVAAAIGGTE